MSEDLLSFKEYSPVHESHTQGGSAQINVNSPSRAAYGATTTTTDPLQDLMDSMSTSINVIHSEDRQQRSPPPPPTPNQPAGFGDGKFLRQITFIRVNNLFLLLQRTRAKQTQIKCIRFSALNFIRNFSMSTHLQ